MPSHRLGDCEFSFNVIFGFRFTRFALIVNWWATSVTKTSKIHDLGYQTKLVQPTFIQSDWWHGLLAAIFPSSYPVLFCVPVFWQLCTLHCQADRNCLGSPNQSSLWNIFWLQPLFVGLQPRLCKHWVQGRPLFQNINKIIIHQR